MSKEGVDGGSECENHVDDSLQQDNQQQLNLHNDTVRGSVKNNGLLDANMHSMHSYKELEQMVIELHFQNEYMKSQFEGLKDHLLDSDQYALLNKASENDYLASQDDVRRLKEKIESLNGELIEERQTRAAAEEALKHLRAAHSEADAKAQEFSAKLAEEDGPRNKGAG